VVLKKLDIATLYTTRATTHFWALELPPSILAAGARSPIWNGGMIETHYTVNPHLSHQSLQLIRMSRQALPIDAANGFCRA